MIARCLALLCLAFLCACNTTGSSPREQGAGKAKIESRDPLATPGDTPAGAAGGGSTAGGDAAGAKSGTSTGATDAPVVQALPDTGVPATPAARPGGEGGTPAPGAGIPDKAADIKAALADAAGPLGKRAIYYDFDAYAIRPDAQALVEAHGRFLAEHRDVKVRIEGNCDERGSRELNLALGQRRADAVKKALMLLGATDKQIQTVSYGAEKPRNKGSGEDAWAENRRSDIIYPDYDPKPQ